MIWLIALIALMGSAMVLITHPPKGAEWQIVAPFRRPISWFLKLMVLVPLFAAAGTVLEALFPGVLPVLAFESTANVLWVLLTMVLASAIAGIMSNNLKLRVSEDGIHVVVFHSWFEISVAEDQEWPDSVLVDAEFGGKSPIPLWFWKMTDEQREYIVKKARSHWPS